MYAIRSIARTAIALAIGFMVLALAPAVLCQTAQAAEVHAGGCTYMTYTAHCKQWTDGGPNVKRQAALIRVDAKNRTHYKVPRYVVRKGKKYLVTEIDGAGFRKCKRAKRIDVAAPLSYVEDMTFWRSDKRHVSIRLHSGWARGYLMGAGTACIR